MKRKPWIASILSTAAASLVLVASPASAGGNGHTFAYSKAVYDYARVISVEPKIRYVTVTTPVKECWEDVEYRTASNYQPGRAGKTVLGAIVGGVVGHQFGSGSGNDAATIAGTLIGAAVGSESGRNDAYYRETYATPVQRCETSYRTHEEERIDGYDVIYAYNGRKYATTTPFDPGKRLRIRVDVRPAP